MARYATMQRRVLVRRVVALVPEHESDGPRVKRFRLPHPPIASVSRPVAAAAAARLARKRRRSRCARLHRPVEAGVSRLRPGLHGPSQGGMTPGPSALSGSCRISVRICARSPSSTPNNPAADALPPRGSRRLRRRRARRRRRASPRSRLSDGHHRIPTKVTRRGTSRDSVVRADRHDG